MEKDNKKTPEDKLRPDEEKKNKNLPYNPDITDEDRQALPDKGLSMEPDEDRAVKDRNSPVDFTAKDLDIPNSDARDTSHEGKDIPDEENHQHNRRGERSDEEIKRDNENDLIDEDSTEKF